MPFAVVGAERIFYAEQGKHGLPVIFIHGAAGNHLIWWNQVAGLAANARAVALDLPGHGRSGPKGRTSVAAYADVVLGLLDSLAFDRAVLVGHSMGGAIAQTIALSHPDRTAGLVLVGTGARLRVLPAILDGVLSDFDNTAHLVTENTFAPGADPELLAKSEQQFREAAPQVTHGDFSACNGFDIMPRVSEIRAPALIICGREDRMTPVKYSEYLASKIPHARLEIVEGAGHSVMLEKPEEVNRALLDFLPHLSPQER